MSGTSGYSSEGQGSKGTDDRNVDFPHPSSPSKRIVTVCSSIVMILVKWALLNGFHLDVPLAPEENVM